jgi:hypothetical protein
VGLRQQEAGRKFNAFSPSGQGRKGSYSRHQPPLALAKRRKQEKTISALVIRTNHMATFDRQQINEIAEQLDCGFRAFCHQTTGELIFIPDTLKFPAADFEEFEEENERLETNRDEYVEIEAMGSSDSYRVMVDFAEQLTNLPLQDALFRALNKRGPFREFKFVIDNSGDFRQQWFDYRHQRAVEWVTRELTDNQ